MIESQAKPVAGDYRWTDPGDKGRMRSLRIDDLRIDDSYQRPEVSAQNTKRIAKDFRWSSFGVPIVMERKNGSLWVVDGQQRLLAAKLRGIKTASCLVFKSRSVAHEAVAVIDLNTHRKAFHPIYKFHAAVSAKLNPEFDINNWVVENGFRVENAHKDGDIRFPAILITLWKIDAEASKRSLVTQRSICDEEALNNSVHRGIWYLYHNDVDVDQYADKIIRTGGVTAILQALNYLSLHLDGSKTKAGTNNRLCGLAVLRVINKKRRRKVRVQNGESLEDLVE